MGYSVGYSEGYSEGYSKACGANNSKLVDIRLTSNSKTEAT
jgi:hypothetical protein